MEKLVVVGLFLIGWCSIVDGFGLGIVTGGIYQQGPQPLSQSAQNATCEFAQLGAAWIRIQSDWVDTPASTYQEIVSTAKSKGIKVNVLVAARFCGDDSNDAEIDQFTSNYVSHLNDLVSTVFAGGSTADSFEIGNEVNIMENGCGDGQQRFRVSPNAFAWLLRRVYQWKQSQNRPELIVSGGLLNTYLSESFWPPFFQSGAFFGFKGAAPFDYFGIHPYNPYTIDTNCINSGSTNCFTSWAADIYKGLTSISSAINDATGTSGVQFFATEFGLQTPVGSSCSQFSNCVNTEAQQAAGMVAAVQAMQSTNLVYYALWYDYRDDSSQHFGLRGPWNGSLFPPHMKLWSTFQTLAGGRGGANPQACW